MQIFKKILFILIVLVLFYIVWLLSIFLMGQIYIKQFDYIINSLGAFFGAFFAFIFLIIGNLFGRYYNRHKKHFNALVNLENTLNEILVASSDNIYLLEGFKKTIVADKFYIYEFQKIEKIEKDCILSLLNIDLINDVFCLNIDIYKVNNSVVTMEHVYNELKNNLFMKVIDKSVFDKNMQEVFLPKMIFCIEALKLLDKKTEFLLAKVRTLTTSDQSIDDWLIKLCLNKKHYRKNFDRYSEKELVIIQKERREAAEKSQEEINKIIK